MLQSLRVVTFRRLYHRDTRIFSLPKSIIVPRSRGFTTIWSGSALRMEFTIDNRSDLLSFSHTRFYATSAKQVSNQNTGSIQPDYTNRSSTSYTKSKEATKQQQTNETVNTSQEKVSKDGNVVLYRFTSPGLFIGLNYIASLMPITGSLFAVSLLVSSKTSTVTALLLGGTSIMFGIVAFVVSRTFAKRLLLELTISPKDQLEVIPAHGDTLKLDMSTANPMVRSEESSKLMKLYLRAPESKVGYFIVQKKGIQNLKHPAWKRMFTGASLVKVTV
eukprot:TRINITY_DN6345_c0_g1_i2.p1 TRINITY_DN6345_c0_g1~~TRINITY_DN6345_c0_g1_i2.p1  ORF type:complete len:275 (+),score=37.19 TRINITY_DN6345_c0_g1_i2:79-903(+)